jgi:murein tripeptide amidase MpaA
MPRIMNTTEIESALVFFEKTYPGMCKRIALPEKTHEGRAGHALRVGRRIAKKTPAVLVIGGVHAREWGGPDIVVSLAGDLLRAGAAGKGLAFGKKRFTAAQIRSILDTTTLVIFPCVNPDGVAFSHGTTPYWRKNRNPASAKAKNPDTIGVDINRNYDFLWNFRKHFHKAAAKDTSLASDDPAEETFHGKKPFSEPETRNVRWLMDQLPNLALFLDLHSYAGDVLYPWGDDQNQCTRPEEAFGNRAFDGRRGDINKGYGEYLGPTDQVTAASLAQTIADAMKAVRGQRYKSLQSVGLYPTCGTSDDYCFARHIVNPELPKTFTWAPHSVSCRAQRACGALSVQCSVCQLPSCSTFAGART